MALLGEAKGGRVSAFFRAAGDAASPAEIIRAARPHLTVALSASRWQEWWLSLLATLALIAIPAAHILPLAWNFIFIGGALLYYEWERTRMRHRFSHVTLQSDDTLLLREVGAHEDAAALLIPPAFVSPWLIVLRVRANAAQRATSIIITPDQLSARDFRALRIRLRHWRRFD